MVSRRRWSLDTESGGCSSSASWNRGRNSADSRMDLKKFESRVRLPAISLALSARRSLPRKRMANRNAKRRGEKRVGFPDGLGPHESVVFWGSQKTFEFHGTRPPLIGSVRAATGHNLRSATPAVGQRRRLSCDTAAVSIFCLNPRSNRPRSRPHLS